MIAIAIIGTAGSATAIAQPIATDPASTARPDYAEPAHGPGAIVGVGGIGIARAKDIEGTAWVGRFEVMAFPVFASADHPGAILGFGYGLEYWRAGPDNWGFALPAGLQLGARAGRVHGVIGLGIHALVVDQVEDDTGAGSYSPYASASLGFRIGPMTAVFDGRVDRRFLYGADDRTQWSLGFMIGVTDEHAFRKPKRVY